MKDEHATMVCPSCEKRHEGCEMSERFFSVHSDQITRVADGAPVDQSELICNSCGSSSSFTEWLARSREEMHGGVVAE